MNNRVLYDKLREYLSLNPAAVEAAFNQYGISEETSISVEGVVSAYRYFKEPFAVDLFNKLYPEIKKNVQLPATSGAVGPAVVSNNQEAVNKAGFWDGFAGVLNGLAAAAPAIADSVYIIKNGKPVQVDPNQQSQPGYNPYPQKESGVNQSVLIYIGIGFLALITVVLVFKKVK